MLGQPAPIFQPILAIRVPAHPQAQTQRFLLPSGSTSAFAPSWSESPPARRELFLRNPGSPRAISGPYPAARLPPPGTQVWPGSAATTRRIAAPSAVLRFLRTARFLTRVATPARISFQKQ